jgi:hypothetical protein
VLRWADAGLGGAPTVVEYAVRSGSVRTADARAVGVLPRTAPCRTMMDGHAGGATFVGVLPLPRYGDLSLCMAFEVSTGTARSQAGVEVVRRGPVLVAVGTTGPGSPDVATLQHAAAVATGRLDT